MAVLPQRLREITRLLATVAAPQSRRGDFNRPTTCPAADRSQADREDHARADREITARPTAKPPGRGIPVRRTQPSGAPGSKSRALAGTTLAAAVEPGLGYWRGGSRGGTGVWGVRLATFVLLSWIGFVHGILCQCRLEAARCLRGWPGSGSRPDGGHRAAPAGHSHHAGPTG